MTTPESPLNFHPLVGRLGTEDLADPFPVPRSDWMTPHLIRHSAGSARSGRYSISIRAHPDHTGSPSHPLIPLIILQSLFAKGFLVTTPESPPNFQPPSSFPTRHESCTASRKTHFDLSKLPHGPSALQVADGHCRWCRVHSEGFEEGRRQIRTAVLDVKRRGMPGCIAAHHCALRMPPYYEQRGNRSPGPPSWECSAVSISMSRELPKGRYARNKCTAAGPGASA